MTTASKHRLILLAVALVACRSDSTSTDIQASLRETDDPRRYSDWSAPVNLGPPVNTAAGNFGSFISKDGLSLYFSCDLACPDRIGGFDMFVSQRASLDEPWGPPQSLGQNINTTFDENAPTITTDGHVMLFTSNRP